MHQALERYLLERSTLVALITTDAQGVVTGWNPGAEKLFGYSAGEATGQPIAELLEVRPAGDDAPPRPFSEIMAVYRQRADTEQEWCYRTKSGRRVRALVHVEPLAGPGGEVAGYVGVHRDITGQRAVERYIDHLTTFNGRLAPDGTLQHAAQWVLRVSGVGAADVIGRQFCDTPWFSWDREVRAGIERVVERARLGHAASIETRARLGRQTVPVWVSVRPVLDDEGDIEYLIAEGLDLSALEAARSRISDLAYRDPLTGLANRRLLMEHLDRLLAAGRRHGTATGLVFIDLDGFKPVNDAMGHPAGDELLRQVAARLADAARAEDVVARLGGDEFVLLMGGLRGAEAALRAQLARAAERIAGVLRAPFTVDDRQITIGASVGLALAPFDARDRASLIGAADQAMYRAKAAGRNRHAFFDRAMQQRSAQRFELRGALARALDEGAIGFHLQPIVELASGRVIAAEALARWHDAERGWVPPAEFIPVAEEAGLIEPLGRQVLEAVCAAAAGWRAGHPLAVLQRISVNVSAQQFANRRLARELAACVARHGVRPERLLIEITESTLMEEAAHARAQMRALKAAGFRLAIDDFGTGYSSLAYLKHFPVDGLKLDRSFVTGMTRDARDERIVRGVIALADGLGLGLVAEGVETEEEAERLRLLGCTRAQGYLFGRPMPVAELAAVLAAGNPPSRAAG